MLAHCTSLGFAGSSISRVVSCFFSFVAGMSDSLMVLCAAAVVLFSGLMVHLSAISLDFFPAALLFLQRSNHDVVTQLLSLLDLVVV
ncbi:hypothetical protein QVD17_08903 [Tagetes erecta]|uniref:Uncharacterized protein n=1 Tax=Tagetes erecta TaxID=13708 RepID=A0AAD8L6A4_TARER|nr:hypothetical protein QVD17_08903 [Tagetes erecta]